MRLAFVLVPFVVVVTACSDDEPAPKPAPPPPPEPEAPVAVEPPPPVPVPLSDPPKPPPEPEPEDPGGKLAIADVRERFGSKLTSKRNHARLTRMLESARRDDRPMVRRVLAEADARARAGAPDALEWKTLMNRLEDHAGDDPEPAFADAWDRIEEERRTVESASVAARDAFWKEKEDEQRRVDRYGGEVIGTEGTRLRFNKPGEGEVTRRVSTDDEGELLLEE